MAAMPFGISGKPVEVVDLTIDDDTDDDDQPFPPTKRRRVDPISRDSGDYIDTQVLPHVRQAAEIVRKARPEGYIKLEELQNELSKRLRDQAFHTEYYRGKGRISQDFEDELARRAVRIAHQLADLPQYQQRPHLELTPSSPPPKRSAPPTTPRPAKAKTVDQATSPVNYRSRAKADALRSAPGPGVEEAEQGEVSDFYALPRRPYRDARERGSAVQWSGQLHDLKNKEDVPDNVELPVVFHIDFSGEEVRHVQHVTRQYLGLPDISDKEPAKDLMKLLKKHRSSVPGITRALNQRRGPLTRRKPADIESFMKDISTRSVSKEPQVLTLARDQYDVHGDAQRGSRLTNLLFSRQLVGHKARFSGHKNFPNEFKKLREDGMELRVEWTNCAGDITAIAWTSPRSFICGTTTHSDSHNQQYNKQGNFLLGSTSHGTLRAYPDHRIPRPVVDKGDNATAEMRRSQDPWVYSSVVMADYDPVNDRAYSSSFDGTVKVWKVDPSGSSLDLLGTWHHGGHVQFVQVSKDSRGMVATAADVASAGVRIYQIDAQNISASPYHSYNCTRALNLAGEPLPPEKWAYMPAAIKWGLCDSVKHFLLVGYSPRSLTNDENDVPEDKVKTGEICVWNALTGRRAKITTASMQNVFEVQWHPSQPCFIVATSPTGLKVEGGIRTQIQIFKPSDNVEFGYGFSAVKTLDCPALDINELAIRPNAIDSVYVAAGCTDGKTYIWDATKSSESDKPIHVLRHGRPTEELPPGADREIEDTGVKFTAFGNTPDRFYTGSSDGVVKVWNIRDRTKPLVRVLMEAPAQISYGKFSPDYSKLIIGDASGRVFLLSVDDDEERPADFVNIPGPNGSRRIRRPKPFIPHPPPPAPSREGDMEVYEEDESMAGRKQARAYLTSGQLQLSSNPVIGAVKGPNYVDTGLFRKEAYLNEDPTKPLLPEWDFKQQTMQKQQAKLAVPPAARKLQEVKGQKEVFALHIKNVALDLDVNALPLETRLELERSKADLDVEEPDYGFDYEEDI